MDKNSQETYDAVTQVAINLRKLNGVPIKNTEAYNESVAKLLESINTLGANHRNWNPDLKELEKIDPPVDYFSQTFPEKMIQAILHHARIANWENPTVGGLAISEGIYGYVNKLKMHYSE